MAAARAKHGSQLGSQLGSQHSVKTVKNVREMNNGAEESGVLTGSIVRMKLTKFLTYDECQCHPGPNLNVILGPNGSGKSSLVCAICLGLAGSPKLLGRADNVGEFVKHGESQGSVELELYNNSGDNYIIQRNITRDNKSNWFLNRKPSTQKCIQDLVGHLNIQINNLCQFLPQEKVVEFAKMSPQELLVATEKAVGLPDMWKNHMDLIALGKTGKDMEASLKEKKEHLEKLQQQNSRLEHEVRRYEERERHLEKIKILEKKRPWAKYEELRKGWLVVKEKRDEMKKVLDNTRRKNVPLERRLSEAKEKVSAQANMNNELSERGRQAHQRRKKEKDKLDDWLEKVKDKENELKGMTEQKKTLEKRIADLEGMVEGLKKELENLPGPETFQPRLQEINNSARAITREINKIQTDAQNIKEERNTSCSRLKSVRDRISRLEDKKNQRLEFLRKNFKDTYDAVMWLRANQCMFDQPVHEPIMLLVNMHNTEDAKYLEMLVTSNDMRAFVCETKKDLQLFMSEVRDKQSLRVNGVAPDETSSSGYKPTRSIEAIERWGFHHYLNELFTTPDAVMRYLCENYRVHEIPLGNEWTDTHADQVIQRSGLSHFYTPQAKYVVKTSRYGNREKSTLVSSIKDAKFFSISVDLELKKQLETEKQDLERMIKEGDEKFKLLMTAEKNERTKLEDLRNEKKDLQQKQNRHKNVINQIETKMKSIEKKKTEIPDIKTEEQQIRHDIGKLNRERAGICLKVDVEVKKCLEISKERVLVSMRHSSVLMEKTKIEEAIREANHELQGLENEFNHVKEAFDSIRKQAKQQLKVAHQATNTPDGSELQPELKELFALYPDAVEKIDEMIYSERAKADCNYQTNPQVIREYERRKKEISKLLEVVNSSSEELDMRNSEVESLKEKWLKPLNELLAKINEKFVGFFRKINCAGEVSLATDQGEDNYEKYGVQVKVKFRAKDSLHVLTQFHQSGGEKSVSTILYLMSLQELTRCPFRVVDEINQGMDPNNERKVFELMVQTATRPSTSQYFLMTPKLLPDLIYSERMTMLFVYNGERMPKLGEWNTRKLLKRAAKVLS